MDDNGAVAKTNTRQNVACMVRSGTESAEMPHSSSPGFHCRDGSDMVLPEAMDYQGWWQCVRNRFNPARTPHIFDENGFGPM